VTSFYFRGNGNINDKI